MNEPRKVACTIWKLVASRVAFFLSSLFLPALLFHSSPRSSVRFVSFTVHELTSHDEGSDSPGEAEAFFYFFCFDSVPHPRRPFIELHLGASVSAGCRRPPINFETDQRKTTKEGGVRGFSGIHRAPFNNYFNFIPLFYPGRRLNGCPLFATVIDVA